MAGENQHSSSNTKSLNRRNFLQTSASATAATLLAPISELAAQETEAVAAAPGFQLLVMATDWGFPGTVDQFCAQAKKEGYDGVEVWWPADAKAQESLFSALQKHSLAVGFLCGGWQADFKEHLASFQKATTEAATNRHQKPVYINCHSGRDYFSASQAKAFFQHTIRLSGETGLSILHETHRSRLLFAAHVTRQYLEQVPDLKLTLDISHWCNVHESLLADQKETVEMALQKAEHIHARIGHAEGPQVNDPRAPDWEAPVRQHFEWWDGFAELKKKHGERMTILTEFGPPGYMPTLPYTRQPVADQWAINVHMLQLLRKRYGGV